MRYAKRKELYFNQIQNNKTIAMIRVCSETIQRIRFEKTFTDQNNTPGADHKVHVASTNVTI